MRETIVDGIDWAEVRRRIGSAPVTRPRRIAHPCRSPESLERRRAGARERQKRHYWADPEKSRKRAREWEKLNPDKVKAKKKRFYDSHKNDPVWMEEHCRRNREYKARKKAERLASKTV